MRLTKQLNYHINDDEDFKGRHQNGPEGAFTRNRRLPFNYLLVAILKMGNAGLLAAVIVNMPIHHLCTGFFAIVGSWTIIRKAQTKAHQFNICG